MHNSTPTPKRERRRPQISCTECRRRKQKCNLRKDGPCTNCLRRYLPVDCYVQEFGPASTPSDTARGRNIEVDSGAKTSVLSHNGGPSSTSASTLPLIEDIRKRYPSIPLSRILHPISDNLMHLATLALEKQRFNTLPNISPEPAIESDEAEKIDHPFPNSNRGLKLMDEGKRELMQRRLSDRLTNPRAIGGMLEMLNSFNTFPVKTSLRNSELFNFYHQYVAPRLCSVDGGAFHPLFAKEILPWQIQSPLMPNVAILMAAARQSYLRDPLSEMGSEALIIKQHVLALVNNFLRQDFHLIGQQAMRVVIHLVIIEWWWGTSEALWSHMSGVKRMIELKGGLKVMQEEDPLNMHVLIVTDYELACGYERDLVFQPTSIALLATFPVPNTYPARFRCPLMEYPTTFSNDRELLSFSIRAAEILDDIRFLTNSITSMMLDLETETPAKRTKIQSTAAWIHKRLLLNQSPPITCAASLHEIINDTILLTAQIFTSAISTLTPFAKAFPPDLKEHLYTNISLVPLTNWSLIPGIFFWILLVATPASEGDYRGRFLRKQMACTGMSIGLEDFMLGTACLRSFWCVQLWIRRESGISEAEVVS